MAKNPRVLSVFMQILVLDLLEIHVKMSQVAAGLAVEYSPPPLLSEQQQRFQNCAIILIGILKLGLSASESVVVKSSVFQLCGRYPVRGLPDTERLHNSKIKKLHTNTIVAHRRTQNTGPTPELAMVQHFGTSPRSIQS
jgi:hypothetical protein